MSVDGTTNTTFAVVPVGGVTGRRSEVTGTGKASSKAHTRLATIIRIQGRKIGTFLDRAGIRALKKYFKTGCLT